MKVRSQFTSEICCPHCGKLAPPSSWPINGDSVPFYIEKENRKFSVRVTCPSCELDFYVVWDFDAGPRMELGDGGLTASMYEINAGHVDSQLVLICEMMLQEFFQHRSNGTLMEAIDSAKQSGCFQQQERDLEHAMVFAWRRIQSPP